MEEIIGLLIAIGAVILKVVGNRLEKSGKSVPTPVVPEEDSGQPDFDFKGWVREALYDDEDTAKPEVSLPQPEAVKPKQAENVVRQAKPATKKPVLMEETYERKGEKIDPKKLVIYSEIMKPKFTE